MRGFLKKKKSNMIIGFLKLQLKWKRFRKIKNLIETLYLFKFRERNHFPLNMSKEISSNSLLEEKQK